MSKIYPIREFSVTDEAICFRLGDALIRVPFAQSGSTVLPTARPEYRQIFEVDEDGLGVHWPLLDEDLSIAGLLRSAGCVDLIVRDIPSSYREDTQTASSVAKRTASGAYVRPPVTPVAH